MKRRNFIATTLTTSIATTSLTALAQSNRSLFDERKPFIVKAQKALFTQDQQPVMNVKISAQDTAGQLTAYENINQNGPQSGPPLHVHQVQDEVFFVVDGEFLFQLGDEKTKVSKGDTVFAPRQVPHTYCQLSKQGHLIFTYTPAGNMEAIFREMSNLLPGNPEAFAKVCQQNGVNFIGPSLKPE